MRRQHEYVQKRMSIIFVDTLRRILLFL
ncbi:hypothetical protein H8B17_08080 [Sphingobacterium arenae]|uniref:Uncharacterized protein n=1 Tax=Sphingobacterium arenae TaxID=1280598 RepID=A0ABR7Y2M3_9SPHI|nr:hypothetical protein [Sphingobacterium arenae]